VKAVIQRVRSANVSVNNKKISEIDAGLLVLLGVAEGDTEEQAKKLAKKIADLRIFPGEDASPERSRRMNLSVRDVGGEVLVVSQFTLLANTSRGNRPSFVEAASPEAAEGLYHLFVEELEKLGVPVKTGEFGAYMQVSLVNDGPVTIILDSSPAQGGQAAASS
jgi:D-tyrosyl-tRNA(Tyr) deacylase